MSTLRINNIEAQSVPASPTIDEKVKVTNSSGDILVNIDGKTSGITTIGINTTDGNIKFDANSNVLITGILTATTLAGNFTPDSLEIGSNIKLGNAGVITATSFVGSGANLTGLNSDVVSDTSPQLGGALDVNGNNINFGDSSGSSDDRLKFGASNDMVIYHDGTRNIIDSQSSQLRIETDALRLRSDAGETYLEADANGALKIYHNNALKFETLTNGTKVTGQQFITEGTILLEKSGAHHHRILANDSGNDLGFQQSSDTGANTNFTTYLRINDGGNISLPVDSQVLNLGASQDMQLYHNGTDSYILNATGNFRIGQYNNANLKFFTSNSTRWEINGSGHFLPDANNSFDIGSTSLRVRNIYTNDLNLSNEGSTNSVDNTWGNYTIQEGESDLFLINNRNGKKYKFNLTEVS